MQAQNHYFTYNESMPVQSLTQSLCALSANFGTDEEGSMSRPFGVALLVAGHETTAAVLTWTTYLLATHPDIKRRVQEEVDRGRDLMWLRRGSAT